MSVAIDDSLEVLELELAYETTLETDELAARRSLRGQIAKLERDLAASVVSAFGHGAPVTGITAPAGSGGPRLLSLGELEALRDELSARVRDARETHAERGAGEERIRLDLERMRRDPGAHRGLRIAASDLGEPGCGYWHVRARFGLLGMMLGWWRVKLSSGCPLGQPVHIASASRSRWRGVIAPIALCSGTPSCARSLLQRVVPHRRWLSRSSMTVMLVDSHGFSRMTSVTEIVPSPTWRLSSARASRTSLAFCSACMC
jgi:hypothetical protein